MSITTTPSGLHRVFTADRRQVYFSAEQLSVARAMDKIERTKGQTKRMETTLRYKLGQKVNRPSNTGRVGVSLSTQYDRRRDVVTDRYLVNFWNGDKKSTKAFYLGRQDDYPLSFKRKVHALAKRFRSEYEAGTLNLSNWANWRERL